MQRAHLETEVHIWKVTLENLQLLKTLDEIIVFVNQCQLDGEVSAASSEGAAVCAQARPHQRLRRVGSKQNRYNNWSELVFFFFLINLHIHQYEEHEQVYPAWFPGMISLRHWATATESVLKLGLPWRMLRPQLLSRTQYGMVNYQQWIRELSITEPKLEVLLFVSSYSLARS